MDVVIGALFGLAAAAVGSYAVWTACRDVVEDRKRAAARRRRLLAMAADQARLDEYRRLRRLRPCPAYLDGQHKTACVCGFPLVADVDVEAGP